jgi:hypothetical protein
MIDSEIDPIILPRYYEGYIAAPDYKYPDYSNPVSWTVWTYPNIVIWQCDTQKEAEQLATQLNQDCMKDY